MLSACAGSSSEEIHPISKQFVELVKAGKKAEAHNLIRAAAEKSPDEAQFQRMLAISEHGQGNIDDGIDRLRMLKSKNSGDLPSRELLIDFLLRKGDMTAHKNEREALISDYESQIIGAYAKGNYKFPREFFYVKDASTNFDERKVNVDGYEYYGRGLGAGSGGRLTRHYRFDLSRQNGSPYGHILLATNLRENDWLRKRGMIEAGLTSYYVRFYVGETKRGSKLIQFIEAEDTPPFEAARQVVINYIKGRPFHQDLEKWMPKGFKNRAMPGAKGSASTTSKRKWGLGDILGDCLSKLVKPPSGSSGSVSCGPNAQ